jgi:hypothetical protein
MSRTTTSLVEKVLADNYDGQMDLQQFIDSATVIVDRIVTCASGKGITLTASELELIERWLAAHCYAQVDMLYASKSTAGASASFQGQTGLSLDSTRYGQMAVNLDYSGCLNAIGKRQFVQGYHLGRDRF